MIVTTLIVHTSLASGDKPLSISYTDNASVVRQLCTEKALIMSVNTELHRKLLRYTQAVPAVSARQISITLKGTESRFHATLNTAVMFNILFNVKVAVLVAPGIMVYCISCSCSCNICYQTAQHQY